jgi:hypothetical protein
MKLIDKLYVGEYFHTRTSEFKVTRKNENVIEARCTFIIKPSVWYVDEFETWEMGVDDSDFDIYHFGKHPANDTADDWTPSVGDIVWMKSMGENWRSRKGSICISPMTGDLCVLYLDNSEWNVSAIDDNLKIESCELPTHD